MIANVLRANQLREVWSSFWGACSVITYLIWLLYCSIFFLQTSPIWFMWHYFFKCKSICFYQNLSKSGKQTIKYRDLAKHKENPKAKKLDLLVGTSQKLEFLALMQWTYFLCHKRPKSSVTGVMQCERPLWSFGLYCVPTNNGRLLVKVASSNFFVNDYYCGSRGQLVPLFRDLDDDGGQAKSCWITTKISWPKWGVIWGRSSTPSFSRY